MNLTDFKAALTGEIKELRAEFAEVSKNLSNSISLLGEKDKEIDSLKESLASAPKQEALDELQAQVESKDSELAEAKTKLDTFEEDVNKEAARIVAGNSHGSPVPTKSKEDEPSAKTLTLEEFNKLDGGAKSQFFASGGKLAAA